jgi:antitoxin CptB
LTGSAPPPESARLRWRCRRGLRELDVLLERYLGERWPVAAPAEQAAFVRLLELPDPDLAALCLGQTVAVDGVTVQVIADITRAAGRELSGPTPVYECDPAGGRLPGTGP